MSCFYAYFDNSKSLTSECTISSKLLDEDAIES